MSQPPMTPQEFAEKMRTIFPHDGYDEEIAHGDADDLLCEALASLGYGDGIEIFQTADKWYA